MVMKAGDLVSLSFGQLLVSHGVPLCFFGEKKRTRTGSWPLLSYAPWVLQLLSEFAVSREEFPRLFAPSLAACAAVNLLAAVGPMLIHLLAACAAVNGQLLPLFSQ